MIQRRFFGNSSDRSSENCFEKVTPVEQNWSKNRCTQFVYILIRQNLISNELYLWKANQLLTFTTIRSACKWNPVSLTFLVFIHEVTVKFIDYIINTTYSIVSKLKQKVICNPTMSFFDSWINRNDRITEIISYLYYVKPNLQLFLFFIFLLHIFKDVLTTFTGAVLDVASNACFNSVLVLLNFSMIWASNVA